MANNSGMCGYCCTLGCGFGGSKQSVGYKMKCPKCGKDNVESAKFCGGCGVPLQETDFTAQEETEDKVHKKPQDRIKWWVISVA